MAAAAGAGRETRADNASKSSHIVPMVNPLMIARVAAASLRLVRDPNRLNEVIAVADELGASASFAPIVAYAHGLPDGPAMFRDRPRVDLELARLRTLPIGSFGRATAEFLDARHLDPANLPHRPAHDDSSWLRAHLYETHDLWHVVTGFDTDVAGEAGLQAFYLAQFPARLSALLLTLIGFNTFLYAFDDRDPRMEAIARGWQLGKTARPFIGVRWAELWQLPLAEVRARLGVTAPIDSARAA